MFKPLVDHSLVILLFMFFEGDFPAGMLIVLCKLHDQVFNLFADS